MGEKKPGKRPYIKPKGWVIRPTKKQNKGTLAMGKTGTLSPRWWEMGMDDDVDGRWRPSKPVKVMAPKGKNNGRQVAGAVG